MQLSIILTTLFNTFATSPDLCADVYTDPAGAPYTDSVGQMLSRYCQWSGPDVPIFDAEVCCTFDADGASCSLPDANGRCWQGDKRYCEYGEPIAGGVICYQPLPSMCDAGYCVQAPDVPPPGHPVYGACCSPGGACQFVPADQTSQCPEGQYLACMFGYLHEDGTVECFDV